MRERDAGLWGVASFFVFLVALGFTFSAYPDLFARLASYANEIATAGPVLPPQIVGEPLIYFLNLSGSLGALLGGIRLVLGHSPRGAIGNILGGLYALFLSHLFTLLYHQTITGSALVFYAILGAAGVLLLTAISWLTLQLYWHGR